MLATSFFPRRLAIAAHRYNKYSRTRTGYNLDLCSWHKGQSCVRESTTFQIFWMGVPLVETVLGKTRSSRHRMGWSSVFVIVEVSVQVSVKSALGQNACPNF